MVNDIMDSFRMDKKMVRGLFIIKMDASNNLVIIYNIIDIKDK